MKTKEILKYTIWAGLYATLIIPFIVVNNAFFPFITGKAFAFRIIVEIIFGLWLILIIKDTEFRPKKSWVIGAAGLLVFVLLIADINAVAPFKAFWSNFERMEGWVTFIHLLAYLFVLGSMFNTEKLWRWFLRANVLAGFIMAVWSLIEGFKEGVVRIAGPLGNPIYISVYFLFIFFFTLILLYKDVLVEKLANWKSFSKIFSCFWLYLYLIMSVLSLFVIYRTSRGAFLGAIGGILVGAIIIAIFEKEKKVIRHIAFGGIILVTAIIIIFLSVKNTSFIQTNATLKRFADISWSNVNGQARQLIWPLAIKGFEEKPILGWGQDGFNYVFNKYYDPKLYNQEQWFDRAHNAPLDFLVAGGLLGFLSYLALFGSALYLLWLKKNNLSITEKSLLTGLFAGYFFQAIFVFDNLISYLMFFTTLAYVHSRIVEDTVPVVRVSRLSGLTSNSEYQNYIFAPAVVIFTLACLWFVNFPAVQANFTLIQALQLTQSGRVADGVMAFKKALSFDSLGNSEIREQLLSLAPSVVKASGLDQEVKRDFLTLTVKEIDKQIATVPNDARYYILMGALLNNIGNPEQALPYIKKAIELSPQKQAMRFELIQSLYSLGKTEEALAEAKSTYELEKEYRQAKDIYRAIIQKELEIRPSFKVEGGQLLIDLATTTI